MYQGEIDGKPLYTVTDLVYHNNKHYNIKDLAKDFFTMSNDDFYALYGFNFVPKGILREVEK